MMHISPEFNFVDFILHPIDQPGAARKVLGFAASIILGAASLGTLQLGCYLYRKIHEKSGAESPLVDVAMKTLHVSKFINQVQSFEKAIDAFPQDPDLESLYDQEPFSQEIGRVEKEWDQFQKLVRMKRDIKKASNLSPEEELRRTSALQKFKDLKCSLAYHILYAAYKKGRLSEEFDLYLQRIGIKISPYMTNMGILSKKNTKEKIARLFFIDSRIAASTQRRLKLEGHKIQWVSGGRSPALPVIVQRTLPGSNPSLIPTGILIQHNIAPLYGELDRGVTVSLRGINLGSLSGVALMSLTAAMRYAEGGAHQSFYFNEATEKERAQRLYKILPETFSNTSPFTVDDRLSWLRLTLIRLIQMGKLSDREKRRWIEKLKTCQKELPQTQPSDEYQKFMPLVGKTICVAVEESESPEKAKRAFGPLLENVPCIPHPEPIVVGKVCVLKLFGSIFKFGVVTGVTEKYVRVFDGEGEAEYSIDQGDFEVIKWVSQETMRQCLQKAVLDTKVQQYLTDRMERARVSNRERIQELISLLQTLQPLSLSKQEIRMIKKHFPILWGSFTQGKPISSGVGGETVLEGPQTLGEDVSFLFVPPEHVDEVREYMKNIKGLHVASIDVLRYLQAAGCDCSGGAVTIDDHEEIPR